MSRDGTGPQLYVRARRSDIERQVRYRYVGRRVRSTPKIRGDKEPHTISVLHPDTLLQGCNGQTTSYTRERRR